MAMPDVRDAIFKQGSNPVASKSPEDFGRFIKSEQEKYRPIVKAAGLEGSQ
jgi:tripartite-type tricarboxylate transporter receptor subunit TctC